jgi:hypothetical protein
MRKLQANENGVVGEERVVFNDKDLNKLDQTQLQCAELCKQMLADCQHSLDTHGGAALPFPLPNAVWLSVVVQRAHRKPHTEAATFAKQQQQMAQVCGPLS